MPHLPLQRACSSTPEHWQGTTLHTHVHMHTHMHLHHPRTTQALPLPLRRSIMPVRCVHNGLMRMERNDEQHPHLHHQ